MNMERIPDSNYKPTREAYAARIASERIAIDEERYGFRWGPLVVQRCCHDEKRLGYMLTIRTDKGREVEIRVSPKGDRITVENKK